jgi:AraC family transcriptional regulator
MANCDRVTLSQRASLSTPVSPITDYRAAAAPLQSDAEARSSVDLVPPEIFCRRSATLPGVHVETVHAMQCSPFEYRFRGPCHLLIASELAERYEGETYVEGLPRSTLRDFTRKLTFVPAGHVFRESQRPRALTRTTYIYIDPRRPLADPALRLAQVEFKPRLFFYDRDLWEIALKLKSLVENPSSIYRRYAEALCILLTHELVRINGDAAPNAPDSRGGLACWQQKQVAIYIDEHIADGISLAALAELARLSPFHFSRSFKRSFGLPPRRYHANRRIERAKQLLANGQLSVTAIALDIGFSDTSTFTAAFHRLTGQTPTRYRRSLD